MGAIKKFRKDDEAFITFEELSKIPINEKTEINVDIPGSIITYRLSNSTEDLSFRVEMIKGQMWTMQSHDCQEIVLMYEGSLKDNVSGKIANRLEFLKFPAYNKHEVIALEDSIFYVEFKNPRKK